MSLVEKVAFAIFVIHVAYAFLGFIIAVNLLSPANSQSDHTTGWILMGTGLFVYPVAFILGLFWRTYLVFTDQYNPHEEPKFTRLDKLAEHKYHQHHNHHLVNPSQIHKKSESLHSMFEEAASGIVQVQLLI